PCRVAGAGVEPTAARGPGGRRAPADGWASGGAEPLALGLAGVFLGLRAAAARITRATVSTPAAATGRQYRRGGPPLPFGAGFGGVAPWGGAPLPSVVARVPNAGGPAACAWEACTLPVWRFNALGVRADERLFATVRLNPALKYQCVKPRFHLREPGGEEGG